MSILLKEGDRVVACKEIVLDRSVNGLDPIPKGSIGTIVYSASSHYGVDFDKEIEDGHCCSNGKARKGHGWDVELYDIVLAYAGLDDEVSKIIDEVYF